jgi:hypothetical protein
VIFDASIAIPGGTSANPMKLLQAALKRERMRRAA